ncbi:CdaR family transcriptional regulator [Gracilibacillus alcaliphilus]|uniref:CdaR family transcriptional regulator n=1 Tax=Gracilibacillus alcaliphilus TaxID=1401441 RepID=UPI00195E72FA|nr:sugar diacid recognition domain-containing protein [Gracilibacillus alcaliphilus]MBM7676701.1 carbohydrate diacid regulator [Gracilibacillus alcaliphilus]
MNILTKEIADAIVQETSVRLNRNVNIMDTEGLIIATRDESRLHQVHEGALAVLESGKTVIIYTDQDQAWAGAQPGINLPITFHEQIIGVIGITGNPNQMGDIGELVRMATELMINQEFIASQLEWRQRTKEMIIEQVLKTPPAYTDIKRGLGMLELDFPPFTIIVVQIDELTIQKQDFIQKIERIFGSHTAIAGFRGLQRLFIAISRLEEKEILVKIQPLVQLLKQLQINFKLAYSLPFDQLEQFNQAYSDCKLALKLSNPAIEIVSFAHLEARALFYQLDQTLRERFANRVLQHMNQAKAHTLNSFFNHNLNIQKTADALFLHRNTLIYRLNKITKETGYDPRIFKDAFMLQVALWIYQQNEGEG